MILLLLASGLVSVCMSQYDDAVSITVVCIVLLTILFPIKKDCQNDHTTQSCVPNRIEHMVNILSD